MSVDRDEVERIAALAKLHLEDDEADRLTEEMNRILEHAARLRGIAADGAEGGAEAAPERTSGTRSVDAEEADELLRAPGSFAPDMREGFFVVPPPPGVVHDGVASDGPGADAPPADGDGSGRAAGDGTQGGGDGGGVG